MTSPHVNTRSFVLKHILRHIKGVSLHSHKFRSTPINAGAIHASLVVCWAKEQSGGVSLSLSTKLKSRASAILLNRREAVKRMSAEIQ